MTMNSPHVTGLARPSVLTALLLVFIPAWQGLLAHEANETTPAEFVTQSLRDEDALKRYSGSAAERTVRLAPRAALKYEHEFDLQGHPAYKPRHEVNGTIRLWGNNYVGDSGLAQRWADAFSKFHPGAEFEMVLPTAAVAAPSLYFGLADISMNHELTFYDYLSHRRILGFDPTGFSVVTGSLDIPGWQNSLVVVVHKDNPLQKLTMKQLDGVFGSARAGGWVKAAWTDRTARGPEGNIRTWGELGLEGDWKDQPINTYGYSLRYATALEFSNRVLGASDKWNENLLAFGHLVTPDGERIMQVEQILQHLENDPHGMAYIRWQSHFAERVKMLALAEKDDGPYYEFTVENVQSRKYPLWGDQSFWVSVKPGENISPKKAEFIRFVLSREGQELIMQDGKYLPLPAEVAARELARLEAME